MRRTECIALTAFCIMATTSLLSAFGSEPAGQGLLGEARRLESASRPLDALQAYLAALERHPESLEALCAASYLYGQVGKRDPARRKEYFNRSLALAQRAHQLDPAHPDATFALAWAYGGLAMISSAREKVGFAQKIKPLVDYTLERKPDEDRAWYVLANWRFKIADASMLERAAAKILAGGLPESATFKTAVAAYRRAVELKPDSILYRRELARALEKDGQATQARAEYEAALRLPVRSQEDPTLLAHCRAALKRLGE